MVQSSVYDTLHWPWSEPNQTKKEIEIEKPRDRVRKKKRARSNWKAKTWAFPQITERPTMNGKSTINLLHAYIACDVKQMYVYVFFPFCPFSVSRPPYSSCGGTNKHCTICSHILKQICVGFLGMHSLVRPQSMTYYYTQINPLWICWLIDMCVQFAPLKMVFIIILFAFFVYNVTYGFFSLFSWYMLC